MSTQSFLTESQRAALDAALAAKKSTDKGNRSTHHKAHNTSGERKSRNSKGTGAAKKGGAGGKFTWGNVLVDGEDLAGQLDPHDPNYDSEEEREIILHSNQNYHDKLKAEVNLYKEEITKIVEEYFSSGDIQNAADTLEDLGALEYMHYFVKKLVTLSLDRKDREREMASVLLSSLYSEVIPPEQMQKGFSRIIEAVDDLVLDVPAAVDMIALFIARAVVDDILPPALVHKFSSVEGSNMELLRQKVDKHLEARHVAERMLRCWGTAGAGTTYSETKECITKMMEEFMDSHDAEEARTCIRKLDMPFFHHEVVRQALYLAIQQPAQQAHLIDLLKKLSSSNDISQSQLTKGFQRVLDNIEDLMLDEPNAKDAFAMIMETAKKEGLVEEKLKASFPNLSTISNASSTNGFSSHSVQSFKLASEAAIKEYFDSSDIDEVARRLMELDDPGLHHLFVKRAITLALDRKDREREMISVLLAALTPQVLSEDQVAAGLTRTLAAVDDMVLDIPDAVHLMSLFLGRAIVDEVLPPSFLTHVLPSLPNDSLAVSVVQSAGAILSARHAAERLQNCWHGGVLTLDQVKAEIETALKEYEIAKNKGETSQILMDLNVPHYHHEVVKMAIELSFEHPDKAKDLMDLLGHLSTTNGINQTQMTQGFDRIKARLEDELLDYPKAKEQFAAFLDRAEKEKWVTTEAAV